MPFYVGYLFHMGAYKHKIGTYVQMDALFCVGSFAAHT